jgi:hypothetical protein
MMWKKARPKTKTLFFAIAGEAESCLRRADWDERIRNMENLITVIRSRMRRLFEEQHASKLDKIVLKVKERDRNVEQGS